MVGHGELYFLGGNKIMLIVRLKPEENCMWVQVSWLQVSWLWIATSAICISSVWVNDTWATPPPHHPRETDGDVIALLVRQGLYWKWHEAISYPGCSG